MPLYAQIESHTLSNQIWREAERDAGFIIAFQTDRHPAEIGFNFLAANGNTAVALHGVALALDEPLVYTPLYGMDGSRGFRDFLRESFFANSAALMGMPEKALRKAVEKKLPHIWRFQGFFNRTLLEDKPDNSYFWRTLWGRIVESAKPERMPATEVSADDMAMMLRKLRNCAVEGQIVLER